MQEQICDLSPTEKVTETSDVPDYNERITLLRYALERYTNFDSDEDIPEAVIEAFVEKIVVNENSFDWYLHFSGDDKTPKTCNVEGDKRTHKIELFGASYAPALVEGCSGCYKGRQVIQLAILRSFRAMQRCTSERSPRSVDPTIGVTYM